MLYDIQLDTSPATQILKLLQRQGALPAAVIATPIPTHRNVPVKWLLIVQLPLVSAATHSPPADRHRCVCRNWPGRSVNRLRSHSEAEYHRIQGATTTKW